MTVIQDEASQAQINAADPAGSTWLAANAGSGKTRVLTDRVARLLLQGVDPQQILCLTYTKAAASEMQNRLFKRLGAWAMQSETQLRDALTALGEDTYVTQSQLAHARTLFARAIETPGGLKIQTIHSFCASLLRRFPLEAGVNPQFEEMEGRAAQLLQAQIVDDMLSGADKHAVSNMLKAYTGAEFDLFLAEIVSQQDLLKTHVTRDDILESVGLPPSFEPTDIVKAIFTGDENALLERVIAKLSCMATTTDQKIAKALSQIESFDFDHLTQLEQAVLTQAGQPLKRFSAAKVQEALGADAGPMQNFVNRVADGQNLRKAWFATLKTEALHNFATPFIRLYEKEKQARGWLDFDDLISRTRGLLRNSDVAAWVLYRLDGGVSHMLVDEAQDTSPAQWDVIRLLTQEFSSGQGAHDNKQRTLFVVGDKKQSIYSFQGADPEEFDRMEREFGEKLEAASQPFSSRSLQFSFRSSDAILRLVDATFDRDIQAGFTPDQRHRAFHKNQPGRVDLWPVVSKSPASEETHWTDPIDHVPDTHHQVVLARQIADQIATMLGSEKPSYLPVKDVLSNEYQFRRVLPGDIMILVQRRSRLFHELIRACKHHGLPIAGADRLRVGAELAVRDLLALLSFLATPEDSLSLATILRSPLLGWTETELFELAHGRKEPFLWETLRKAAAEHPHTVAFLQDLRSQIDFLRPYELLERILTRHRGRDSLLARLGLEAEDGIDALLSQALAYERVSVPSLTGFLIWARSDDLEIKRQADSSGDLIRVMTVHGSKGLEAPIVILPDCEKRDIKIRDSLLKGSKSVVWKVSKQDQPKAIADLIEVRKASEKRERARLLYVAMTRAESWLIIAASGDLCKEGSDWYSTVQRGLNAVGAVQHRFKTGDGLRYQQGSWSGICVPAKESTDTNITKLETFFHAPLTVIPARETALSPSDLGGAKAIPSPDGLDEETAKSRGAFVHALLEHPNQTLKDPIDLSPDIIDAARKEAHRAINADHLKWLFSHENLSEATVHGVIDGIPILGIVDRLIVTKAKVTVVDFKTNNAIPDSPDACPEGILRQMGAYHIILQQIYPDRFIETGILWTATATYMPLSQKTVISALERSPYLDAGPAGS
ncbi:MAG: double-strand break repair helicase AddA [Paracoccaceae bacterium]